MALIERDLVVTTKHGNDGLLKVHGLHGLQNAGKRAHSQWS